MDNIKVGVMGYGTIGRRVADAVSLQEDMEISGVAKRSDDYNVFIAKQKGYKVYSDTIERGSIDGRIEDLINKSDIIVDATPSGVGAKNKKSYYDNHEIPVIYQGGESKDIGVSFSSLANYSDANGQNSVRVVSCNTTGLVRLLSTINSLTEIESVHATLIRRAADPKDYKKGPIDAIIPDPIGPSHHAEDVKSVMDVDIVTTAYKVPTTLMHVQDIVIKGKNPFYKEQVDKILRLEPRIKVFNPNDGFKSTAQIMDYARELRLREDVYENAVFGGYRIKGNTLYLTQAIHQESIVIPEILDAIRAVNYVDRCKSIKKTNDTLGISS